MIDLTQKLDGVSRFKSCKIKADCDEKIQKTVHVTVDFTGTTIEDVIEKAMSPVIINYQSSARKKFESISNNEKVTIQFKAPSRVQGDPEELMFARIASMTPEAKEAKRIELLAKLEAMK